MSIFSACFRILAIALAAVLVPAGAFAQAAEQGAPPATVRLRLGPLYLNPTIALTGAGVDDNVFNAPDQLAQSDVTATLTPATDLWLRFGPTWINGNVREDLIYYQEFASQRSANTSFKINWIIPFNRLTLNPGVIYLNTRDRPGFEIDTRAKRTEVDYNGLLELRVMSKTFVGTRADRRTINFDETDQYRGTNLHDELNRTVTTFGLAVRHQATPLTSITFDVLREQDRFQLSPDRDTDSTLITGGLTFDPAALIKGSATFGFRNFQPSSTGVPGYKGSMAAVTLSYVALGTTRLAVTAGRDVQYSYDVTQPYYLLTGIVGSVSQQIFGPVDVVGRLGAQQLAYRDLAGADVAAPNRVDHIRIYGAGVGYHLGRDMRIGFNVDHQNRLSPVSSQQYNGLVYGFAVTYGS